MKSPKELLVNPLTAALGAGSGVLVIFDPNLLFAVGGFVWANIGSLFPAASTLGFFVLPEVDLGRFAWLKQPVQGMALLLAMVFVLKQLNSAYEKLQQRL